MSFLDPITAAGPASDLVTTGTEPVNVSQATPPNPGDVLTAVDAEHATWQPPSGGGGGDGGNAAGLETTGDPVDVSGSAPPIVGQVLMAVDAEHAEWRVPGLHYDPSIKFWTSGGASATIAPGTWGFVQQDPESVDPITVFVVSSLEAPPVDSRFGLYVGRDVAVPVTVQVVGASQIQGLDGELGPTTQLLPGADYEWVFYHEDSIALWGLVSDTAGVAKRVSLGDAGIVPIVQEDDVELGSVLTFVGDHAEWLPPSGGGLMYIGSSVAPSAGQWCLVDSDTITMPSDATEGDTVGMFVLPNRDGAVLSVPSGQELFFGNQIADSEHQFTLRGGAYYEWTLQSIGEGMGWYPRGMSNEQPAPLTFREAGETASNEWVLSSDYGNVVHTPAYREHGDSFGVFVDNPTLPDDGGGGATVLPATGDLIESPDLAYTADSDTGVGAAGVSYYEWIWNATDGTWHPRQNMLMMAAAPIFAAIQGATTPLDLGSKKITHLADPTNPQDAVTKFHLDATLAALPVGVGLASTAPTQITVTTAAVGAGTTAARDNHVHSVATAAPAALTVGAASADGVSTSLPRADHVHAMPGVATTSAAGFQSAADKVKSDALSLTYKEPVRVVSGFNQPLTGLQTIDGVSLVGGDRVLLRGQLDPTQHGIWIVSSGAWTRSTDADTSAKLLSGTIIPVNEGSIYADTLWILTSANPVLGVSSPIFQLFGGLQSSTVPQPVTGGINGSVGGSNQWATASHIHKLVSSYKEPVRAVSTSNIAALTGLLTVDSITLVANDRVLLTGQTTQSQNGIWVASSGAWTRALDASAAGDLVAGMTVYVNEGTANADTRWALTTNDPIVLGTTNLTFALFGGLRGSGASILPISPIGSNSTGATPKWAAIDHGHAYQIPDPTANGFRLSTSLTTPVAVDGTYSTIFLAAYKSNKIAVWDTTLGVWQIVTAPVTSQANLASHTAGTPVDVFVRYTGSSNTLAFDLINWNTPTTRASALTTQDGVTVRSGGSNARYVGTFLPDSATTYSHVASASDTSSPVCGIWNQDNRIRGAFTWTPTFDTWATPAGTTNTWQSLNAQASAKVQYVQGQSLDIISAVHIGGVSGGSSGGSVGIGIDSTSVPSGLRDFAAVNAASPLHAKISQLVAAGPHNLNAIANGGATSISFYGAHAPMQGGITAELWY